MFYIAFISYINMFKSQVLFLLYWPDQQKKQALLFFFPISIFLSSHEFFQ